MVLTATTPTRTREITVHEADAHDLFLRALDLPIEHREAFLAEERPAAIGWAEQRYVNEFTLARAERPGDLFVFYPTLPDERERRHVMSRVDLDAGDFEGGAVRVRLLRTAADAEAVRYQLIVIAESRRSLSADGDAIMRWHNVAHNAINEAFERVITDETRRRMRQV